VSLRDHDSDLSEGLRLQLEANKLWKSDLLHFRGLVESIECSDDKGSAGQLHALSLKIRKMMNKNTGKSYAVVFNLARNTIEDLSKKEKVISPALCTAAHVLKDKGVVSCEDFLASVFGLNHFDSQIHLPKIHNSIARLRKILDGHVRIKVKAGFIYAEGSWDQVGILVPDLMNSELRATKGWSDFLRKYSCQELDQFLRSSKKQAKQSEMINALKKQCNSHFTRKQAEEVLGTTRSTTNRIIEKWSKNGIVRVDGKGKQTKYSFKKERSYA